VILLGERVVLQTKKKVKTAKWKASWPEKPTTKAGGNGGSTTKNQHVAPN
jgi:hypothetical protein